MAAPPTGDRVAVAPASTPPRGDVSYVRTDEPLDELGRPCGLRAWSIFLEEDLLLGQTRPGDDGVVRL